MPDKYMYCLMAELNIHRLHYGICLFGPSIASPICAAGSVSHDWREFEYVAGHLHLFGSLVMRVQQSDVTRFQQFLCSRGAFFVYLLTGPVWLYCCKKAEIMFVMYSYKDKERIWRLDPHPVWWQQWWFCPHWRHPRGSCTSQATAYRDGWKNGLYDVLVAADVGE